MGFCSKFFIEILFWAEKKGLRAVITAAIKMKRMLVILNPTLTNIFFYSSTVIIANASYNLSFPPLLCKTLAVDSPAPSSNYENTKDYS